MSNKPYDVIVWTHSKLRVTVVTLTRQKALLAARQLVDCLPIGNPAAGIMGIERQTEVCDVSLAKPTKGIVGTIVAMGGPASPPARGQQPGRAGQWPGHGARGGEGA